MNIWKGGTHGMPGGEPVDAAVNELAAGIHSALMRHLNQPSDLVSDGIFDPEYATLERDYPNQLFGALALHIAGIRVPEAASAADRSRAILQALRRIATAPHLLEAITGAPAGTSLLEAMSEVRVIVDAGQNEGEVASTAELRHKIAETGYLERSMFDEISPLIQLEYVPKGRITHGLRRNRNALPSDGRITLKLAPKLINWKPIKQYRSSTHSEVVGRKYYGYIGSKDLPPTPAFTLVALEPASQLPPRLTRLINTPINVGRVTTGTELKLLHSYGQFLKEVPGYGPVVYWEEMTYPAALRQAYLGSSQGYPLFETWL